MPRPVPPPAPVPPPTSRSSCTGMTLPRSESWNRAGSGAPKWWRWVCTSEGTTTARFVNTASTCSSVMWRIMSGSTRSPVSVRRTPSSHAARPVSSCIQRTRKRSASRRIPLSFPLSASRPRCMGAASAGSSGRGATRGGVSASTTGLRSSTSWSVRPSWRASASTRNATDAPVIRLRPVSVSMPMRISCAWSARSTTWPRWNSGDELAARQLGQLRHRFEVGVEPGRGAARRGSAAPRGADRRCHAPRRRRSGGYGVQLLEERALRRDLSGEAQVDGDVAGDGHDDLAGRQLLARRHAGEQHRLPDRVAQRRDPEVVLELCERLRERLGDRTGAVDRAACGTPRISVVTGRDWRSQRWPSMAIAHSTSCGPPKRVGDGVRQRHEPPQVARRELGTVALGEVERPCRWVSRT